MIITISAEKETLSLCCHLFKPRHAPTHSGEEKVRFGSGVWGEMWFPVVAGRRSHILFIFTRAAHGHISEWLLFHKSEQKDGILYEGLMKILSLINWPVGALWAGQQAPPRKFQIHLFLTVRVGVFSHCFIISLNNSASLWLLKHFLSSFCFPRALILFLIL